MEFILQLCAEVLLQFVFELMAEIGVRSVARRSPKDGRFVLRLSVLAILGAVAGGASVLMFPESFLPARIWRLVNLVLTPFLVAALFAALGRVRQKRGQSVHLIDTFAGAYVFALGLAAVRFLFAQ